MHMQGALSAMLYMAAMLPAGIFLFMSSRQLW